MYLKEVYINENVWADIKMHGVEGLPNEIAGFLMGYRCILNEQPLIWITKSVKGNCTSSPAHVVMEVSTYDRVMAEMEAEPISIIGWYHTHPGIGVFLSSRDLKTISQLFSDPSSVSLVLDPKSDIWGFFGWDEKRKSLNHLNTYLFTGKNYKDYLL